MTFQKGTSGNKAGRPKRKKEDVEERKRTKAMKELWRLAHATDTPPHVKKDSLVKWMEFDGGRPGTASPPEAPKRPDPFVGTKWEGMSAEMAIAGLVADFCLRLIAQQSIPIPDDGLWLSPDDAVLENANDPKHPDIVRQMLHIADAALKQVNTGLEVREDTVRRIARWHRFRRWEDWEDGKAGQPPELAPEARRFILRESYSRAGSVTTPTVNANPGPIGEAPGHVNLHESKIERLRTGQDIPGPRQTQARTGTVAWSGRRSGGGDAA